MTQNLKPVITNTQLWYKWATGLMPIDTLTNINLVGTFINGLEFCASPIGYTAYETLQSAVVAFGQQIKSIVIDSPVEHIKAVSGYQEDDSVYDQISELLFTIQRTAHVADTELIKPVFEAFWDKARQIQQPFQDVLAAHRNKMKMLQVASLNPAERRLVHREITQQLLEQAVGGLSLRWWAFELFISTFDEWIWQLCRQPALIMSQQDWYELLNLVYVPPGYLYWTDVQSPTSDFIVQCGCRHYLYQPSP